MDDGLDPHIFFGIQKSHYAQKLNYVPKPALIVEVSSPGVGMPSVLATKTSPDELEDWLNKQIAADRLGTTSPGLRLILGTCRDSEPPPVPPVPEGGDTMWPGDYQTINNSWPIPFSRSHFDVIIDRFSLPQSTRWLCRTTTRHLQTYRMRSSVPGCKRYGLTFRGLQALDVALSLSHDTATGVTTALMLGQSSRQAEWVRAQVVRLSRLAHHPALLPTLLLTSMRTAMGMAVEDQRRKMHAAEVNHRRAPLLSSGWNLSTSAALVDVARLCGVWVSYTERTIAEIERLMAFVVEVRKDAAECSARAAAAGNDSRNDFDGDAGEDRKERGGTGGAVAPKSKVHRPPDPEMEEIGLILEERLDFILHKAGYTLSTAKYVRERSMDFIPTMNNYISQSIYVRMSNLRLRDMKFLKAVTVVATTFLPGILATTFFSTSFMSDVHPPQWSFWASAVPFVIGVLVLWRTWDSWMLPYWMKKRPSLNMPEWMADFKRWARRRVGLPDNTSTTSSSSTSIVSI